ncbi:uncharacterized protein LOC124156088 isoform X2 [Ischnura elegans]|uniref:uncharacterized protein LOC124156088 isoform X2 n=1 Tax=Ischnura elegans TaxID=197161 RepID=UPI001ED8694B|nr:uncharacterized protein LOC124156088 isoform X2 [Ischnura elegans]
MDTGIDYRGMVVAAARRTSSVGGTEVLAGAAGAVTGTSEGGGGVGEEGGAPGGGEGGAGGQLLLPPPVPPAAEEPSPAETTDLVKVILLGAPAVGKTSIVQQFVWNEFCDTYYPTDRRHTYYPSVVINGRLYDLKISDLPPVPYFPVDSLLEWTDYRAYGLRSATAYVLVFDLSNAADTFRHIKCLREQMAGSRDMRNVPVVVVGNKHDRLHGPLGLGNRSAGQSPGFRGVPCLSQASGFGGISGPSSSTLPSGVGSAIGSHSMANYGGPGHANSMMFQQQSQSTALAESRERRDIANIVKKHWRCGYVECSAKYNWRVVAVFKELMKAVDSMEGRESGRGVFGSFGAAEQVMTGVPGCGRSKEAAGSSFGMNRHHGSPMVVDNLHDALDRSKCEVL